MTRASLEQRIATFIDACAAGSTDHATRDALLAELSAYQAENVEPYRRFLAAEPRRPRGVCPACAADRRVPLRARRKSRAGRRHQNLSHLRHHRRTARRARVSRPRALRPSRARGRGARAVPAARSSHAVHPGPDRNGAARFVALLHVGALHGVVRQHEHSLRLARRPARRRRADHRAAPLGIPKRAAGLARDVVCLRARRRSARAAALSTAAGQPHHANRRLQGSLAQHRARRDGGDAAPALRCRPALHRAGIRHDRAEFATLRDAAASGMP